MRSDVSYPDRGDAPSVKALRGGQWAARLIVRLQDVYALNVLILTVAEELFDEVTLLYEACLLIEVNGNLVVDRDEEIDLV